MEKYLTTTEDDIEAMSHSMLGMRSNQLFNRVHHERFKMKFGVTVEVCVLVWNRMVNRLNRYPYGNEYDNLNPMHMLYALIFLRMYPKSRQINGLLDKTVCHKSFKKWTSFVIRAIAALSSEVVSQNEEKFSYSPFLFIVLLTELALTQILWSNRHKYDVWDTKAKITVDGTDFRIFPPNDGDNRTSWYSHKFKGPAVRYEVAVSIHSGDIVWTSGPWRAGCYPDITIFRKGGLKQKLLAANEKAEADLGYRGEPVTISLPDDGQECLFGAKKKARMRHETVNKRFKNWACMAERFRHGVAYHHECFMAIVVLTQFAIENGEPLFDASFNDARRL